MSCFVMFRHAVLRKCHVLSWSPMPPVPSPPRPDQHRPRPPSVTPAPEPYWIHTSRPCLHPARSRARLLPALRPLSSPRPPSRGPSLTRATAAAGAEQAQPLKLPPGPRLGPGSGSGATVGGVRCKVTGPRCVHAVAPEPGSIPDSRYRRRRWRTGSTAEAAARTKAGPRLGGRGDERGLIDPPYPFCSIRCRLVRQAGPCFARIARGCGRVSAPARFARARG